MLEQLLLMLIGITGLLFLCTILVFWKMRKQKQKLGILTGERIYQDTEEQPGVTLYAISLPLMGRPDYLLKTKDGIIPVEVKSTPTPATPYFSHTMQVMAYCLLVEETYGRRPPRGILKYPDKEVSIEYTLDATASLRRIVHEMLAYKANPDLLHVFDTNPYLCLPCKQELAHQKK
jgi:CRISPR-associated exonuclease Cas4